MEINSGSLLSRIDIKNMTLDSRKALCGEWKSSGLKASEFCKQKGLCRPTFHGWCAKLGSHPNKNDDSNKRKYQKVPNQMIIRLSLSMDDIQLLLKGLCDATTIIR